MPHILCRCAVGALAINLTNRRTSHSPALPIVIPSRSLSAWLVRFGAMGRLMLVLAVAVAAFLAQPNSVSWHTRAVASWDLSTLVYLLVWRGGSSPVPRRQDDGVTTRWATTKARLHHLPCSEEVASRQHRCHWLQSCRHPSRNHLPSGPGRGILALTIDALISSWLLIHTVFAFHYARRYYAIVVRWNALTPPELVFPGSRDPDYLDFAYYQFVVWHDLAGVRRRRRHIAPNAPAHSHSRRAGIRLQHRAGAQHQHHRSVI